jgi:hypothetical protein
VIAYFYYDFHSADARPDAALRSLVKQLSLQCTGIPDILKKVFSEHADGHRSPTREALMSVIKCITGDIKNVYIVFDALDECPERVGLLSMLREMHAWGHGTLHMLTTSRKERDIEETLHALVSHEVAMDESLVDGDIHIHVTRTLAEDIKFQMCSAEEKAMIETTLIKGARGM